MREGRPKTCGSCRYWSEMIAKAEGGGPVKALCLSAGGEFAGKYTTTSRTCAVWQSGHLGAIDDPPNHGTETRAAYAAEEEADHAR